MSLVITIALGLLLLNIIVVIHEAGHLACARFVGVGVEEFAVGFGPRVPGLHWQSPRTGTVYGVRALPLGGFVRLKGMEADAAERALTGGTSEDGTVDKSFPKPGGRYSDQRTRARALIIIGGPAANVLTALLVFLAAPLIWGQDISTSEVQGVVEDGAAATAGIKAGDVLVAVDGVPVSGARDVDAVEAVGRALYDEEPGSRIELVYERAGNTEAREVTLGASGSSPVIGVSLAGATVPVGVTEAVGVGAADAAEAVVLMGGLLRDLATGNVDVFGSDAELAGPVGIVSLTGETAQQGGAEALHDMSLLAALISLDIAIMNLLPILPLDGGHLAVMTVDRVLKPFGRRVSKTLEKRFALTGLALVLVLAVLGLQADIARIVTGTGFLP